MKYLLIAVLLATGALSGIPFLYFSVAGITPEQAETLCTQESYNNKSPRGKRRLQSTCKDYITFK